MEGARIVNLRGHAEALEMVTKSITLLRTNGKLVVDVDSVFRLHGQLHLLQQIVFLEQADIVARVLTAGIRPAREVWELDAQNRRLKGVQAAIDPEHLILIFLRGAMDPEGPQKSR